MVALQGEITNHPRAAAVKNRGGERCGERRAFERVRCDPMKANESKLFIDQVVSSMEAARAWVRLRYGTWEPVVPRDGQPVVCDLRLTGYGRIPSGRNREDKSTDAGHRGGPSGSSDEGSVMGLERSGRAILMRSTANHEVVGGTNG